MLKAYRLIVRDRIIILGGITDDGLKALDGYYESPVFFDNSSKGVSEIATTAFERYKPEFSHFRDPNSITLIPID